MKLNEDDIVLRAIADQNAYDHYDRSAAYNNIVILSSGSEFETDASGVSDEYRSLCYGSTLAVKHKYSKIYLGLAIPGSPPVLSVGQLLTIDGRAVFLRAR